MACLAFDGTFLGMQALLWMLFSRPAMRDVTPDDGCDNVQAFLIKLTIQ
jgi:hypothetical protein